MRPSKEIEDEIQHLQALRPKIRRFTAFGNDNWEEIDAQIKTLTERLDTDDALADEFLSDEVDEEPSDREYEIESSARDAMQWMLEEKGAKAPSEDWQGLVK